jgi:hypothetical protein
MRKKEMLSIVVGRCVDCGVNNNVYKSWMRLILQLNGFHTRTSVDVRQQDTEQLFNNDG